MTDLLTRLRTAGLVWRLAAMVLALAIPLNLVVLLVIAQLTQQARDTQRAALNYSARTIAAGIDSELGKYLAIGESLSRSPHLVDGDLKAFEVEARRGLQSLAGASFIVADLEGRQLLNSSVPPGGDLASRPPDAVASQRAAMVRGSAIVSDLHRDPIGNRFLATVEVPVLKNGQPFQSLAIGMNLEAFQHLLSAHQMPTHWVSGIIDGRGRYIARVPDGTRLVGALASEGWRATLQKPGVAEFATREGDPITNFNAVPKFAPWTAGVGAKQAEIHATALNATRWSMISGGLLSLLSLALSVLLARKITQPLAALRRDVSLQRPIALASGGPSEIGELAEALRQSAATRRANERRQALLLQVTSQLIEAHERDEVGRVVYDIVGPPHGADVCFKYRFDPTDSTLTLVFHHGIAEDDVEAAGRLQMGQAFCGSVAQTLEPLSADAQMIARDARGAIVHSLGIRAYCCHPLRARDGRILGTFSLASTTKDRFEPEEISFFFAIANVLAQAVERIEAEKALRQAHHTFRHLVDQSPFGIYIVDADFRLARVSIGAQSVFSTVTPSLGRDFEEVMRILWPEPFVSEALAHFRHTLATGEPYRADKMVETRADLGTTEAYDWKIERVVMPDGRFGVVCHFYDLSERQRHVAEMAAAHERQGVLMRELAHRGKNLLSVVQAIARRTFDGRDLGEAHDAFSNRLQALARSYGTLTDEASDDMALGAIVVTELGAFAARTKIDGPQIMLPSKSAQTLALVVHELATNAVKHGALSNELGQVAVSWRLERSEGDVWLAFEWRERGGPLTSRPSRSGFGTVLVKHIAGSHLGCEPELAFKPEGVIYRFRTRLANLGATARAAVSIDAA